MATESREERRLIRQRGAGARELKTATFGFSFGGFAGIAPVLLPLSVQRLASPVKVGLGMHRSPRKEISPRKNRSPVKTAVDPVVNRPDETQDQNDQEPMVGISQETNQQVDDEIEVGDRPIVAVRTRRPRQIKPKAIRKTMVEPKSSMAEDVATLAIGSNPVLGAVAEQDILKEVKQVKKRGRPPKKLIAAGSEAEHEPDQEEKPKDIQPQVLPVTVEDTIPSVPTRNLRKKNERDMASPEEGDAEQPLIPDIQIESCDGGACGEQISETISDILVSNKKTSGRRRGRAPKEAGIVEGDREFTANAGSAPTPLLLADLHTVDPVQAPGRKTKRAKAPKQPSAPEFSLRRIQEVYEGAICEIAGLEKGSEDQDVVPKPKRGRPKRSKGTEANSATVKIPVLEDDENYAEQNISHLPPRGETIEAQPSRARRKRNPAVVNGTGDSEALNVDRPRIVPQDQGEQGIPPNVDPGIERTQDASTSDAEVAGGSLAVVKLDEKTNSVEIQPQRRRGRPPKSQASTVQKNAVLVTRSRRAKHAPPSTSASIEIPSILSTEQRLMRGKRTQGVETEREEPVENFNPLVEEQALPTVHTIHKTAELLATNEPIQPRKRGRPRKADVQTEAPSSTTAVLTADLVEANEHEGIRGPKATKERRQRKAPTQTSKTENQGEDVRDSRTNINVVDTIPQVAEQSIPQDVMQDVQPLEQTRQVSELQQPRKTTRTRGRKAKAVFEDNTMPENLTLEQQGVAGLTGCSTEKEGEAGTNAARKTSKRQRAIEDVPRSAPVEIGIEAAKVIDAATLEEQQKPASPASITASQTRPLQQRSANLPSPTKRLKTSAGLQKSKPARPFPVFMSTRRGRSALTIGNPESEWRKEDWFEPSVPEALLRGRLGRGRGGGGCDSGYKGQGSNLWGS